MHLSLGLREKANAARLLNPLSHEAHLNTKDSVRTTKKTQHFTVTKISWLTLFKEIIAVYSESHMKPVNTLCGQNAELLIPKAGGTYSYHWNLRIKRLML
jgi:hypothetical protein